MVRHVVLQGLSRRGVTAALALSPVLTAAGVSTAKAQSATDEVANLSRTLVFGSRQEIIDSIGALIVRGNPDVAAAMILALRYRRSETPDLSRGLEALTGHKASGWFDWMVWQEANPQVKPHYSFAAVKREVLGRLDPEFLRFLPNQDTLDGMKIRLEEITWGGVSVDGIPSLDHPTHISAGEADYLLADDLVFGVEIDGDARAYPLRIMGWHEMFNEVIGGVPLALAYCTLCGAGILFETQVAGRAEPFVFGSSGLLYRSNKLMFDRETDSLWNQFTGEPVSGPLVESGIKLKVRPVAITSWERWRSSHPDTKVLSLDTGYARDYGSGVVYQAYFASDDLMFPAVVDERQHKQKDYVFGIRDVAHAKAWPLEAFAGSAVINDAIGPRELVLIGDEATRTVRAYERRGQVFEAVDGDSDALIAADGTWQVGEEELSGPDGTRLPRVPGHVAYWFAWDGYLGAESELYVAHRE